jgi:hypothetical protein
MNDARVTLINQISRDILNNSKTLEQIENKVNNYGHLIEDTIRNSYELVTMGNDCPLFVYCYYKSVGRDNFCMSEDEFNTELLTRIQEIKQMFGVDLNDLKESDFNANFASKLFNIEIKDKESIEKHFIGFCNDFSILSQYHNDYTIEEMIGIAKFLQPVIIFDENIREFNQENGVRLNKEFRIVLERLKSAKDRKDIDFITKVEAGEYTLLKEMIQDRIRKDEKRKES